MYKMNLETLVVPDSEEVLIQQNNKRTHTHTGTDGIMSKENRNQLKEFPRAKIGRFWATK